MYEQRTGLYRLYAFTGRLLYLGVAENPETRWKQHARTALWWAEVDESRTTVEWYPNRRDAEAAETRAIEAQAPVHNVVGSPTRTYPKRAKVAEIDGVPAMGTVELRAAVSARIEAAHFRNQPTIVTKNGTPRAALISMRDLQLLVDAGIAPPMAELLAREKLLRS